jgi:predicted enzyme related to lactoylglutathione lyase
MAFRDAFPILHTPNLERAVGFYSEQLGFEQRYRWPENGRGFAALTLEKFSLGLTQSDEVTPAGRVALWLYTDDVDREIDRLRVAGVEIVAEPADMEWGERMATILDPDGNEIYLGQRL